MLFFAAFERGIHVKKLLIIGLGLALGGCVAQQSAMQAQGAQPQETATAATGGGANREADRREDRRRSDAGYVSTLERRDVTGSRINRVRRRGEPVEDTTAGKRVETISREQIEELGERGYDGLSDVLPAGD